MSHRLIALAALALAAPLVARGDDPDPVTAAYQKAKDAHQKELERLRKELLDALQKREDAARNDGNKKLVDQVKAEREAFEAGGALPKIVPTTGYRAGVKSANAGMLAAYKDAVKGYVKAKLDDKAAAAEAELKEFEKDAGLAKEPPPKAAPKEPYVVASWAHQVNHKGDVRRSTFKLYSNGRINNPNGRGSWSITGNVIVFTWPDAEAPGGAWKDVCTLSADAKSYVGKNQLGAVIKGVRINE